MPDENYGYSLRASAGATNAILQIHDNREVVIELHWSGMGDPYHYRLYGKHEPISDAYGWIHVHRVEDLAPSPATTIPIEALGTELIYEYVKLPRSRFLQHPKDMLWVAARWHEFFDLILFTSNFVLECHDSLKYGIAEGILEETEPEDILVHINDTFMGHLTHLLVGMDKMKFTIIEENNAAASG